MNGLKYQKEKQHGLFCGTGRVSQGDQVCIVDDTGKIVREVKVASEPEALRTVLVSPAYHFKSIGFEAGPVAMAARVVSVFPFASCRRDLPSCCRHLREHREPRPR